MKSKIIYPRFGDARPGHVPWPLVVRRGTVRKCTLKEAVAYVRNNPMRLFLP